MLVQVSAIEATVVIAVGVLGIYYWVLYRFGILKPGNTKLVLSENIPDNNDIIPRVMLAKGYSKMILPPAIDTSPMPEPELINESDLELLDEVDTTLLKEAEIVVEKIQDTINHIASDPPNPEEVTSKIHAIVSPYKLFIETEYYDSINTYIALALERDCGMKLSPEDLQSLWN
jgi:hypothetical protein